MGLSGCRGLNNEKWTLKQDSIFRRLTCVFPFYSPLSFLFLLPCLRESFEVGIPEFCFQRPEGIKDNPLNLGKYPQSKMKVSLAWRRSQSLGSLWLTFLSPCPCKDTAGPERDWPSVYQEVRHWPRLPRAGTKVAQRRQKGGSQRTTKGKKMTSQQ